MKHGLIALLQLSLMVYAAGSAFFLVTYYADDIDGLAYAASLRMQHMVAAVGGAIDMAAAVASADDPNIVSVHIVEGWRKEQIAAAFKEKLDWDEAQYYSFAEMLQCIFETSEGKLLPGMYSVPRGSSPEEVRKVMISAFEGKVASTTVAIASSTPLNMDKVLVIASLIQREAAGKRDMNIISGVIWNRILSDMSLDIDATLQYAKGDEKNWWPQVKSEDKFIDSPFNTYENKGLPPHPIANPGLAAISAALSPADTPCLYYLHDRYRRIHCSPNYAGHKRNIDLYLR